ncbi:hypothetical protein Tco_1130598, partial [Tanacetum coccineum]
MLLLDTPSEDHHPRLCRTINFIPLYALGYAEGSFPKSFQWHAPIGGSEFLFWNLYVKVSKEFLFLYPADQALFTRFEKYLFRPAERIRMSGPTDGANVEAYLRRPLRLGKRASNVRIIWFSFGSFGSYSFGSSAESKNVVQLRLLWRLLQLLRPLAESAVISFVIGWFQFGRHTTNSKVVTVVHVLGFDHQQPWLLVRNFKKQEEHTPQQFIIDRKVKHK